MGGQDQYFMQFALDEAHKALKENEVPVGAVVVCNECVVAREHNAKEQKRDPTAHAEVLALQRAAEYLARWRLSDCSMYVTLEPCPMCMGAMLAARINRLVFGCIDPKAGAAETLYHLGCDPRLNHFFSVKSGVLAEQCAELLRNFFRGRRKKQKYWGINCV
jgi:tRNA(adenine34) deaminase